MTKRINIGGVTVGGGAPVRVQSMTTTPTVDVRSTVEQIVRLAEAGCEIVRVAVRDEADARAIRTLRDHSPVPIVADIHFFCRSRGPCGGKRGGQNTHQSGEYRGRSCGSPRCGMRAIARHSGACWGKYGEH